MAQTDDKSNRRRTPLDKRVLQVTDAVGAFIEYWGFKAVHGRVWALLALRRDPMAQTEIAEFLGVSRSLISGSISELSSQGLVTAIGDHRNAPYAAALDVWPVIKDVLRGREWMLLESTRLALESAVEEADVAQGEGREVPWDVERMRLLLSMTELSQALLRILFAIGVPRSMEGFSEWIRKASSLITTFRAAAGG
jgi:HTH-type transcriptional regulator, glycine betaine synthesis regulator